MKIATMLLKIRFLEYQEVFFPNRSCISFALRKKWFIIYYNQDRVSYARGQKRGVFCALTLICETKAVIKLDRKATISRFYGREFHNMYTQVMQFVNRLIVVLCSSIISTFVSKIQFYTSCRRVSIALSIKYSKTQIFAFYFLFQQ